MRDVYIGPIKAVLDFLDNSTMDFILCVSKDNLSKPLPSNVMQLDFGDTVDADDPAAFSAQLAAEVASFLRRPDARPKLFVCCDCGVCEHVACPMGLSPRRINQAIKNELRAAGMKYEGSRDVNEAYTQWREFRRVPVPRLVNKIGISRYMELPTNDLGSLSPAEVRIPLRQHIGAPAQAVVKVGDRVKCGDVIGEIPEQGLGARIHASMDGVVKSVDGAVVIGK